MKKGRLEAFSDGVLAIIITIMVLELKVPQEGSWEALREMIPTFLSYAISFLYVGIFWNNHHHLLQITEKVNGKILWGNLHLLFWISFIPFVTAWAGENYTSSVPVALYGIVLIMASIAFFVLKIQILRIHSDESLVQQSIKGHRKEGICFIIYFLGTGLSFVHSYIGIVCYLIVAIAWLVPERRIENVID